MLESAPLPEKRRSTLLTVCPFILGDSSLLPSTFPHPVCLHKGTCLPNGSMIFLTVHGMAHAEGTRADPSGAECHSQPPRPSPPVLCRVTSRALAARRTAMHAS